MMQQGGASAVEAASTTDSTAQAETQSVAPIAADEIVVTATRKSERLQNVPMSINVVSGSDLKKLNLLDAKDIQQLAPGLELTNTTGRTNTATLRGIPFDPDSGTAPAVDLYYNEIPVSAQTAFTALYDIDQIEVLRGPQGALRGRTSPAGSITIASRKPDLNEVDGYAQVSASNRNSQNFQGAVSLPIIPGELAIRAAMLIDHNRLNQLYNVTRNQHSNSNTESARLSLAWVPAENLRVDLSYQYLNADNYQFSQVVGTGNQPSLFSPELSGPPATIRDRIAVADGLQRFQNNSHLLTGSLNWDIGQNTLSLIGGYQHSVLHQANDLDPANAVPGYAQQQRLVTPYIVKTAELRFASHDRSFWNYSLDAFFSKQTGTTRVYQPNNLFFADTTYNTPYPYSFGAYLPIDVTVITPSSGQTFALAGSSSFQFTPRLRLELAARYSWYKNVASALIGTSSPGYAGAGIPAFDIPPTETILPANQVRKPKALTGSATVTYEITPNVTAYANYGRSFRPGVASTGVSVPVDNSLIMTKDETANAIEVGFKTSFLDHRLSITADGFYQKFNNYIGRTGSAIYVVGNDSTTAATQLNFNGDAEIKGVETTLSGRITPDLDLSVSMSYVKARYKNALAPCNDYNGDGIPDSDGTPTITGSGNVSYCLLNSRLTDSPDFSLSSNAEYRFHVGDLQPFIRYLFTYTPKVFSVQANYAYQDRENLNLYAGVRGPGDRWEFTAFVKNVLNQQRITNYGTGQVATINGVPFDPGYALINSTLPREIGASLLFNF